MAIKLYNTLTGKIETFKTIRKKRVGLYTCGPTVYNYAHIGNLRTYIFEDILRRMLKYAGYDVYHVMNITDVGHLTSDADAGQDKLEKEAEKEKKTVWDIARFYTKAFFKDIKSLNIKKADIVAPATKHIPEQIQLVKKLIKKGFAYETSQAVYFDTSKFKNYTKLSRQDLSQKRTGVREEVVVDSEKRNSHDFALWFKAIGHFEHHAMRWSSPWGVGFPGWHLECSAISTKFLGQPFDIHTGGVDHINVHHTNEIAQSEAAINKMLARYWLHGEFLLIRDEKMAKSEGNFLTLQVLEQKNINPIAFRYFTLSAHYRTQLNFTWESLYAAQTSLDSLCDFIRELKDTKSNRDTNKKLLTEIIKLFEDSIFDDLNMPKALATVWVFMHQYHKDSTKFDSKEVLNMLYKFDEVFGLNLRAVKKESVPAHISALVNDREMARKNKDFARADILRAKIQELGWLIEDTPNGPKAKKTAI